jgi:hypothetical protein
VGACDLEKVVVVSIRGWGIAEIHVVGNVGEWAFELKA